MAQKPVSMDQLKQLLQLKNDGIGVREMARRLGISRNSVRKYLVLLNAKSFTEDVHVDDRAIVERAYNNESIQKDNYRRKHLIEHFQYAKDELPKTGVTRQLLWNEYIDQHPDGYAYSQYCHHLKAFLKSQDLSMHLEHNPGDVLMVDFAGKKRHYIDSDTGEQIECEVFVAVLPSSGLIFCYAVHSQQTADFIACMNAMLKFYGGVPITILCDNLKTAVTKTDRYEPVFTEVCHQLSDHYHTTFSATRPYRPRDKAMVERAVNIVYAHVYAPLRHRAYHSLAELNQAMHEQLLTLNNKPYKNSPYSRWYYFEQQEQALLKPLPSEPFCPKKVVILTVQRNYHVQLTEDHHYYSVPYKYAGKKVKVLYDQSSVEVYLDLERIAVHVRKLHGNAYTTAVEHMPPAHHRMHQVKGWTKEEILSKAARMGESVHKAASLMLHNSICVEQNYKACFGMLMLSKKYGLERLEGACARALTGTRVNYTMINNILKRGLDRQILILEEQLLPTHENIRGKEHYQ